MCNKGITQFYLSPTHEPYLPLLPSRKASPPFGWYSLCLPTKGWPGWVDLCGWSHTEINVPHRELNQDTVTHLSTNRARWWFTSLIEANALTTTPDRQPTCTNVTHYSGAAAADTNANTNATITTTSTTNSYTNTTCKLKMQLLTRSMRKLFISVCTVSRNSTSL